MAIDVKALLRVAPLVQSAALAENALRVARKKKKKKGDLLKLAGTTIVGSSLIAAESDFINGV